MLSEKTIEIVKSTVPVLQEYGKTITSAFYKRMLGNHPELLNYFNHANQRKGTQPTALANTILAAGQYIDQLETILPVVKQIAQKHRALSIRPEHYPIVGENLLAAIKEVLGDAATDDIIESWAEAYGVISNIFIQVEAEMYKEAAMQKGGWADFKPFTVVDKVKESDAITSFYLKPMDGTPVPSFMPGQYITVKALIPGEEFIHNRHYSLSAAPGNEYFRISVKKEDETNPRGKVSTYLHEEVNVGDKLEISAPAGDFVLNTEEEAPVVFLAGGVGITPLLSMFETLVNDNSSRNISFVQTARNENVRALHDKVNALAEKAENASVYTILDEKLNSATNCDLVGYVNREFLEKFVTTNSVCYVCGPASFMGAAVQLLTEMGLPAENIRYEFFGPAVELEVETEELVAQ